MYGAVESLILNLVPCLQCLREGHTQFNVSTQQARLDFKQLGLLDRQIKSYHVTSNPYTWFTLEALDDSWQNLLRLIKVREEELLKELKRQEKNDDLRKSFAQHANAFHSWLTDTR